MISYRIDKITQTCYDTHRMSNEEKIKGFHEVESLMQLLLENRFPDAIIEKESIGLRGSDEKTRKPDFTVDIPNAMNLVLLEITTSMLAISPDNPTDQHSHDRKSTTRKLFTEVCTPDSGMAGMIVYQQQFIGALPEESTVLQDTLDLVSNLAQGQITTSEAQQRIDAMAMEIYPYQIHPEKPLYVDPPEMFNWNKVASIIANNFGLPWDSDPK